MTFLESTASALGLGARLRGPTALFCCAMIFCLAGLHALPSLASSNTNLTHSSADQVADLIRSADELVKKGLYTQAQTHLKQASSLARARNETLLLARSNLQLADILLVSSNEESARSLLDDTASLLEGTNSPELNGALLVTSGNLYVREGNSAQALQAFQAALKLGREANVAIVESTALTNMTRLHLDAGEHTQAWTDLEAAIGATESMPVNDEQAFQYIALGRLGMDIPGDTQSSRTNRELIAHDLFQRALLITEKSGARRLSSQAYGFMGELYMSEGRYEEALALTSKATFLALETGSDDVLYLWQWQTAKIQVALGHSDEALDHYRIAVATVQRIRPHAHIGTHGGYGDFGAATTPLFYELADLLLRAPASEQPDRAQTDLARMQEARETVELLKAMELQDYFQDDCVTSLASRTSGIDSVADNTAVLYSISLPDRLELLLSLPGGMRQVTVPVTGETLSREIEGFQRSLQKRTTRQYLRQARQLYDWLIRPIEPVLTEQGITTLVSVPRGSMAMIPFAALNDGKQFLIDKYALATTPGLALTEPEAFRKREAGALLGGVSESVQGFPALPNVSSELESVESDFGGTVLKNDAFSQASLSRALQANPFPVVHIATHAQFKGQSEETFVLTWDDRIDLDGLEDLIGLGKYRSQPVELLVLSACQTATGDERAALGLAGIAVKAGARSALASLWFVNDASTRHLMTEFYSQLAQPGVSKAQALQIAQQSTKSQLRYQHPIYWAPFLLIGNWL